MKVRHTITVDCILEDDDFEDVLNNVAIDIETLGHRLTVLDYITDNAVTVTVQKTELINNE